MEVAFTGTTAVHSKSPDIINKILGELDPKTIIRTGAAIGIDELVAVLAKSRGFYVRTYVPANRSKIDLHFEDHCDEVIFCPDGKEPYRIRNTMMLSYQNIDVKFFADHLYVIALYPEFDYRSTRSGTWMTARIARGFGISRSISILEGSP